MMEKDVFGYKVLKTLSKEELNELFLQLQRGNLEARKTIIEHNIGLVIHVIKVHFGSSNYEKEDLVSIGLIGLIKAVDTYNLEKNVEFSTYAFKCIDNEVRKFSNKVKKDYWPVSLDDCLFGEDEDLCLKDILVDEFDFVEQFNEMETYEILNKIIEYLPNKEKEIVKLHFGFYNETVYSQQEIANKMGVTRSYINFVLKKAIKRIRILLSREDKVMLVRKK